MAKAVHWTEKAIHQVEDIGGYIAADSQINAKKVVLRIYSAVERLARFPRLGRRISELDSDQFREIIEPPYRIMYRLSDGGTEILAVIHGARDFRIVFGDDFWDDILKPF